MVTPPAMKKKVCATKAAGLCDGARQERRRGFRTVMEPRAEVNGEEEMKKKKSENQMNHRIKAQLKRMALGRTVLISPWQSRARGRGRTKKPSARHGR